MANFCRFCGKSLVDGQCSCPEFQASLGKEAEEQYKDTSWEDPFIIPSFKLDFSSFSGFVASLRAQSGVSDPLTDSDPYETNVAIVPDCVQAEENEIIVKQYNIARLRTRLKFMKAEGRLMVTNRRILFRAAGTSLTGNILQEHQFNLDEVGGIEMHNDYKFSILSFLGTIILNCLVSFLLMIIFSGFGNGGMAAIGIILGVLGLVPTFIVYKHFWLKLLCAAVSSWGFLAARTASFKMQGFLMLLVLIANVVLLANLIIVSFVPNLVIKIKTKGASGAVVIGSQKAMFRRKTGDDYSGFAEVMPWDDTIMAMNELGTMIDDLQKQGDYAVEKWTR